MEFEDNEKIRATLLYHLRRKRVIGAKHTPFDTLKMGFPNYLGKEVVDVAKELIKKGFIITKPAPYGLQVSLNKERLKEIEEIIKNFLGYEF